MLERLEGKTYYCFLDGYSGYNQIVVNPEDQELNKVSPPRKIKLKQLPSHMKYVFIDENGEKPIIISNLLSEKEEQQVI